MLSQWLSLSSPLFAYRFIPRGSVRIGQTGALDTNSTLLASSFVTPSDEVVVVVLNADEKASASVQLQVGTQYAHSILPPHSIQTLTFNAAVFSYQ